MPKFLVAFNVLDVPRQKGVPRKIVKSAIHHIKAAIKNYPGTDWEVATYILKFDVQTVCSMLESLNNVEAEEVQAIHVNEQGQCRNAG